MAEQANPMRAVSSRRVGEVGRGPRRWQWEAAVQEFRSYLHPKGCAKGVPKDHDKEARFLYASPRPGFFAVH